MSSYLINHFVHLPPPLYHLLTLSLNRRSFLSYTPLPLLETLLLAQRLPRRQVATRARRHLTPQLITPHLPLLARRHVHRKNLLPLCRPHPLRRLQEEEEEEEEEQ